MLIIAIAPLFGFVLLALGAGAVFLLSKGEGPAPPTGTPIIVGAVGPLSVEVKQQTTESVEWYVRKTSDDSVVGSGAGTYNQNPLAEMLEVAFDNAPSNAAVTLTFLASGMRDARAKTHGDVTLSAEPKQGNWSWSVYDDSHDVVALGEMPSRGAALLKAEEAMGGHLGMAIEGFGGMPVPTPDVPGAHGVAFHGCTLRVTNAAAWLAWARAQVKAAFDGASGLPTPDDLLDATVGVALADAGVESCEIEDLMIGTKPWVEVEADVAAFLGAIEGGELLSIPGPDEMLAGLLGGTSPDNRGAKETYGEWSIVVRPADGAPPAGAFRWWAWHGPRMLDADAELQGVAATQAEGLARAKTEIDAAPALVNLEGI